MVKDVIDNLQSLKNIYQKMFDISLQKKQAIIDGDIQAVSEIVKQEWELLSEISNLEEDRIQIIHKILIENNVDPNESISLLDMEQYAAEGESSVLKETAEELKGLIDAQKKINNENKGLINLHLEYMDYMVNIVLKEPQVSNIYGSSGEIPNDDTENRAIIDNQV